MSENSNTEQLILQEASYDNLDAVFEMHDEMGEEENGFTNPAFGLSRSAFETYIETTINCSKGIGLRPGLVPQTTYWLMRKGYPVGLSRLRHHLNDALRKVGGHIGYYIRPAERKKGYGYKILTLTLEKAALLPIEDVLLTCDSDNLSSRRIIEKHGGRLDREDKDGDLCCYWITLNR